MYAPSVLLLIWCGLAATMAAAIIGVIIGRTPFSWSLAPRAETRAGALTWSLLGGLIAYPIAYGLVFEATHRADIRIGVLLGAMHGAAMFMLARPRGNIRNALRTAFAHLFYALTIAFLYVTP
jgi:hypothetical protein